MTFDVFGIGQIFDDLEVNESIYFVAVEMGYGVRQTGKTFDDMQVSLRVLDDAVTQITFGVFGIGQIFVDL